MIQINLLPVREARRAADLRQQGMQLLFAMMIAFAGIGFVHSRISDKISESTHRMSQMERDIEQFKPQLDQVAAFRKKKSGLEKKIGVIDELDRARSGPVRVMDELATHTPERLWLTKFTTKGANLEMVGESLDNELVAVFLTNLQTSPYFSEVELDSAIASTSKDGLKIVSFKIQAVLVAPAAEVAG